MKGRARRKSGPWNSPLPPWYRLKGVNLYWLTITLGRGEGMSTSRSPYVFNFMPAR